MGMLNLKSYALRTSVALSAMAGFAFIAVRAQTPSDVKPAHEFVIRSVRVFDGSRVIPNTDVWVHDGRIRAIGAHVTAPAAVRAIDGTGKTLLPGLIDSHVHTWGAALEQALVFGVTTALDMFTDFRYADRVKKEQTADKGLALADLRSAGTLVTAPKGHGTEYGLAIPTITSPDEAQAFVDARIAEGSDYIKIIYDDGKAYRLGFPTLTKDTLAAVIAAAHKRHKLAVVHIGSLQAAREAIEAGADGLMHLFIDRSPDGTFAALVAEHRAFVVPTLCVLASITHVPAGKQLAADRQLQPYLSADAASNLGRMFPRKNGELAFAQETVRLLRASHVPVLAGSDAPNPGTAHGASMHEELQLLVESGLTPTEALAAATSVPAVAFHLADRGQIVAGKRADLLLVQGDPTVDIRDSRNIVSVWKLGVEVDRAAYRASLNK